MCVLSHFVTFSGSIHPPPSKPPRLNLYSDEEIDAEFNIEGKPVFVPPSPPLTPPSASVPTEDVRKLIAEGRLSIEEGSSQLIYTFRCNLANFYQKHLPC